MPDKKLTPVERGALLVLMAQGRPLKENAELKAQHGISLKSSQRAKLQRLGLIKTTGRPMTHSLTEKGWEWVRDELAASKPKGQMGMGALYAVLGGVGRFIERRNLKLEDVFGRTASTGLDLHRHHMREAAWSDADEALAQALQDIPVWTSEIEKLQRASPPELSDLARRTASAAKLVLQSVRAAGRRRQLAVLAETGSETVFDPVLHRSGDAARTGERVRVRKSPVIRGPISLGVVVVPGEVERV
ncbi:MAG: hypothetical protein ACREC6_07995 [Hyphomicrobiaceae bacterium]